MRELLFRRSFFFTIFGLLLLVAGLNLYWFRDDFAALAHKFLRGNDPDVARWERWARQYDQLFAMLGEGERVGIQIEGQRSSGIVLERTSQGMIARRSLFLGREKPGVILTFPRRTAEQLLASVPGTDPEAIWQMMKDRLYTRQMTIWNDPDIERLQRGGYLAFMRAIDTRPPDVEWPGVKARLGEK